MFKLAVVISALVAVALAAPVDNIVQLEELLIDNEKIVVDETLVVDQTSVVNEILVDEEKTLLDEIVVVDQTTIVNETPLVEQTTVVNEAPLVEQTTVVNEAPLVEQTTVVDEAPLVEQTTSIPILWEKMEGPNADGSYSWSYETGNGIRAEEKGAPKEIGTGDDARIVMAVEGKYSYIDKDGTVVEMTYIADENGFRATGAHIPTPPPMLPAVSGALE